MTTKITLTKQPKRKLFIDPGEIPQSIQISPFKIPQSIQISPFKIVYNIPENTTVPAIDVMSPESAKNLDIKPDGAQMPFAKEYAFKNTNQAILVIVCTSECETHCLVQRLTTLGFNVSVLLRFKEDPFTSYMLEEFTQIWVISDKKPVLTDYEIKMIVHVARAGIHLNLLGDNDPYIVDVNRILAMIVQSDSVQLKGDWIGRRVLAKDPKDMQNIEIHDHHITFGLHSVYSGSTVSYLLEKEINPYGFVPVLSGPNGIVLVAARKSDHLFKGNIVVDGGFTKSCPGPLNAVFGNTSVFYLNVASWLCTDFSGLNIEPMSEYPPLQRQHARMDPIDINRGPMPLSGYPPLQRQHARMDP